MYKHRYFKGIKSKILGRISDEELLTVSETFLFVIQLCDSLSSIGLTGGERSSFIRNMGISLDQETKKKIRTKNPVRESFRQAKYFWRINSEYKGTGWDLLFELEKLLERRKVKEEDRIHILESFLQLLSVMWVERYGKFRRREVSKTNKKFVLERDRYRCVSCGGWKDLCIDHIVPVSMGGSSDRSNLQTLCRTCNLKKGRRLRASKLNVD